MSGTKKKKSSELKDVPPPPVRNDAGSVKKPVSATNVADPTKFEYSKEPAAEKFLGRDFNKYSLLTLHGYRVGRTIGKGSYATVKEATSQKHRCKVAIKIITKKNTQKDYIEKFLPREIEVIKILKHPSIVLFNQCIETTNRVYLIMEYLNNGDLLEAIRNRKIIPENQAAVWFAQMMAGIEYCHNQGVVHRDLKCENLLLDNHENLKLTDFGFARSNMKPLLGQPVLSETYCGSYAYAAPEILTGCPYRPQLADIWSMGVILYVMVIGRLPFDDSNHRELLKQVRFGPTFPHKRPISNECKNIITKILVRREDRPPIGIIKQHVWYQRNVPVSVIRECEPDKGRRHSMPVNPISEMKESKSPGVMRPSDQPAASDMSKALETLRKDRGRGITPVGTPTLTPVGSPTQILTNTKGSPTHSVTKKEGASHDTQGTDDSDQVSQYASAKEII